MGILPAFQHAGNMPDIAFSAVRAVTVIARAADNTLHLNGLAWISCSSGH